ncbi:hypothetical protein BG011_010198 [Mortierella polycephala]|uniref:DUF6787 domain-containing protein n=1 Tax=Mortierella polycephala TaxID=41804 RepID=A0A9P6QB22_9FUNG|nr:hypothetical protein BG011_010198 [Mortierella polycephala]
MLSRATLAVSTPSLSMLSSCCAIPRQSTRHLSTAAQSLRTSSSVTSSSSVQSVLSKRPFSASSFTFAQQRTVDSSPISLRSLSTTTSKSSPSIRSYTTRSSGSSSLNTTNNSAQYHISQTKMHQRTSIASRAYTSSSSSSSSSSTAAAGSTARILAEESSHIASTATASVRPTPLSHHEEMTKVRFSFNWWKEWTIIMGVFAVTGSSTVLIVKPIVNDVFKLEGSMKEGPWSFRVTYLCTTLPLYSCVLLTVATIVGRRPYFKKVVLRMWGRFLPKKAIQRFQ